MLIQDQSMWKHVIVPHIKCSKSLSMNVYPLIIIWQGKEHWNV